MCTLLKGPGYWWAEDLVILMLSESLENQWQSTGRSYSFKTGVVFCNLILHTGCQNEHGPE